MLDDKKKHIIRNISILIGSFTITFLLVLTFVIPLINREFFYETVTDDKQIKPIKLGSNASDPENATVEAYSYWFAPPGSFGIQEQVTVNWSWFWKVFKNNSRWQLEAWHPVQEQWVSEWHGTNLNSWLNITKLRNETNSSEKITLNVTNMHPSQDLYFRFKFGIDLRVKEYINRSSWYEYELTYPANNTENYTVFFNFSDVKPLIQNETVIADHGFKNYSGKEIYYFMLTQNMSRNPLGSGKSFEIDPTFGNTGVEATQIACNNIRALSATPSSSGTVDNITVYLRATTGGSDSFKCALYVNGTNPSYIDTTEEKTITRTVAYWEVFNFSSPPSVTSGTYYDICVWASGSANKIYYTTSDGYYCFRDVETYNGWPDPLDITNPFMGAYSIYASYTESVGKTWQEQKQWNISIVNKSLNWNSEKLWNISITNQTITWFQDALWNISIVNKTFSWIPDVLWNISIVNKSLNWVSDNTWNISIVNKSLEWKQDNIWNISIVNKSLNYNSEKTWNISIVNTSTEGWTTQKTWNISIVNKTLNWNSEKTWNISIVNLTKTWESQKIWNITIKNTSSYKSQKIWNISIINSSIDFMSVSNIFPSNNSINIPLQPTMYLTISHTEGETMNASWYYGSQGNENNLLGTSNNFTNSTQSELNWNASDRTTDYYWRIMVDDGTNYQNFSYTFETEGSNPGIFVNRDIWMISALFLLIPFVFYILSKKKKKEGEF